MSLDPNFQPFLSVQEDEFCLVFATLVLHYWSHSAFLPDHFLIKNIDRFSHLPCVLIHGRLDVSSPLETAWPIHQRWPRSEFIVVPHGHRGIEMYMEVTKTFDKFKVC